LKKTLTDNPWQRLGLGIGDLINLFFGKVRDFFSDLYCFGIEPALTGMARFFKTKYPSLRPR